MTPAQKATIKADIIAKQASGQPLFGVTAENLIVAYYNGFPGSVAWRTEVPTKTIRAAITFSSYTPNDSADNTATFTNRALLAQTKQINLQIMLQGLDTVDMSLPQARADLRDAVIQLPTGAGGAFVTAGGASGVNVLNACTRPARVVELLLANPAADATDKTGNVTARILTFEGALTDQNVSDIIAGL